jgi:phosphoribosylanthranilate isomerase
MKVRIKICGITTLSDGLMAAELGADALGFVFASSKRKINPKKARSIIQRLPPFVTPVGVFRNDEIMRVRSICCYTGIEVIQLHGEESPEYCRELGKRIIKCIHVKRNDTTGSIVSRISKYPVSVCLLDSGCGSGVPFPWDLVTRIDCPIILAGGLNPENVKEAVRIVRPYGVDVSSGVEKSPGKKDSGKVRKFIQEAR